MPDRSGARLTACSFNLFHAPYFLKTLGTTPSGERAAHPDSDFLWNLDSSIRPYSDVVSYPPNQVFIGNLDPRDLPEQPWYTRKGGGQVSGEFGDILDEVALYGLIKYSDVFDLVLLEHDFSKSTLAKLESLPAMKGADLSALGRGKARADIDKALDEGAFPLYSDDILVGCIRAAHPADENLSAHTMTENLAAKATAVYAMRRLNSLYGRDPADIHYIIETSEEACGDMNQRGGGNFAKAVGELADLREATGSDTRSFCAGPVHGLMQAASLVASGTFSRVVVLAGGTTAKLAMNAKKHIAGGLPVLEDVLAAFAVLVEQGEENGLVIRIDAVGTHTIGAGAAPQAVVGKLVADPLKKAGFAFSDIDVYAPELHNPEITGQAGAGNVTLQNLKMIAAMAVMKKEITRDDINGFIASHGVSGWAPTQGHIPSGIPALGWFLKWAEKGSFKRGLVIGKGSLFLGRMTNLFDGVSLIMEVPEVRAEEAAGRPRRTVTRDIPGQQADLRLGFTVTGAETGREELESAAAAFMEQNENSHIILYGATSEKDNQSAMEAALGQSTIDGALTFHYNFPIGTATTGLVRIPPEGKELFIATATGTTALNRVHALVKNALFGRAAARAWGIDDPLIGFLNLEGAASALKAYKKLIDSGYRATPAVSTRGGDGLLRGNDILKGACDVLVCDSLTGNAVVKLISAYDSAGVRETTGAGYGCGLFEGKPVGIISRATGASVAADALAYLAKMVRRSFADILQDELTAAEEAGLEGILKTFGTDEGSSGGKKEAGGRRAMPEKTPVDSVVEGIDVLEIEYAVEELLAAGIYCQSGMGCTGPVVMVSSGNRQKAVEILKDRSFL